MRLWMFEHQSKYFLATQNTKCGYPAKIQKYDWGTKRTRNPTFVFIYTSWKLIMEKSKRLTGIQLLMFHMIMRTSA